MTTHVDRLEISLLSDPDFPPDAGLATSFLSSPMPREATDVAQENSLAARFVDRPMHPEPTEPQNVVVMPQGAPGITGTTAPTAQTLPAPPEEPRVFPPGVAPETETVLAGLSSGERHALETLYGVFLAANDPYLESDDLSALAERLDCNEARLRRETEALGRLGLLRLARGGNGEVVLAESTFAGLEAFCREARGDGHAMLLEKIGRCVAEGRATDGPSLVVAFPGVPGLLLTHAVETLARDGWLECNDQFGGACGFHLGRISPDLKAWAGVGLAGEPRTSWAA